MRNCTEWFDLFFAVAGLGAVLVPVNFLLRSKEVEFILNDSGASVLLVGEDLLDLVGYEKGGRRISGISSASADKHLPLCPFLFGPG